MMALVHGLVAALAGYPPVAATMGTLLMLVFLDMALGIAAAVKTHTFKVVRVADFVGGDLVKVVVVLAFGFGAQSNDYLASAFYLSGAATATALVGKIGANTKTLFGVGLNLPTPPLPRS